MREQIAIEILRLIGKMLKGEEPWDEGECADAILSLPTGIEVEEKCHDFNPYQCTGINNMGTKIYFPCKHGENCRGTGTIRRFLTLGELEEAYKEVERTLAAQDHLNLNLMEEIANLKNEYKEACQEVQRLLGRVFELSDEGK